MAGKELILDSNSFHLKILRSPMLDVSDHKLSLQFIYFPLRYGYISYLFLYATFSFDRTSGTFSRSMNLPFSFYRKKS